MTNIISCYFGYYVPEDVNKHPLEKMSAVLQETRQQQEVPWVKISAVLNGIDIQEEYVKRIITVTNILGYLPILGTVVGLSRIIFASLTYMTSCEKKIDPIIIIQFGRGFGELCYSGRLVLCIADIATTVFRY